MQIRQGKGDGGGFDEWEVDIHWRTILRAAKEGEGTFAVKVKSWCAVATKVDKAGTNWRCPSQLGAPEDRDPGKDWAGGIRLSADRESF